MWAHFHHDPWTLCSIWAIPKSSLLQVSNLDIGPNLLQTIWKFSNYGGQSTNNNSNNIHPLHWKQFVHFPFLTIIVFLFFINYFIVSRDGRIYDVACYFFFIYYTIQLYLLVTCSITYTWSFFVKQSTLFVNLAFSFAVISSTFLSINI